MPRPPAESGIWQWADLLGNAPPAESRITLGEGNTPLVRSQHVGPAAGLPQLYFKLESNNPSGSYKDRFAVSAVSHMRARGAQHCLATSSGNTGSALAAACAVAGIPCRLAIVEPAPDGKLRQMLAYGAELYRIRGFGIDPDITERTFSRLKDLGHRPGWALQVSALAVSPEGMSGVETLAYELDADLDAKIDHVFLPAGGGGLCLAVARGFEKCAATPAIQCVQPEGNDTMAGPLREGRDFGRKADPCTTNISGLQVPNLLDADAVIAACRKSGGTGHLVSDESIFELQRRLAREEGIFCEPAGAVALAGALQAAQSGEIDRDAAIVCVVTGSGFKDEASVERMLGAATAPMVNLADFESAMS
ncbi:MAG: pyridoxal-phosphate dependent enzyme [Verrucomicrobiae bacterium]|nr:pyridoxal-phosphate dependent enzyme [Verrucomicrobiae bacterium]